MPSGGKINVTFSRKGRRIRQSMRVEHSEPLAFWTFPRLRTHESYAVDGCVRTCFDYFSKTISWIVGKNKATTRKEQRTTETGCTANRTDRRANRTAHFTAARKSAACIYFSAFRQMRLAHSAVVNKAYVKNVHMEPKRSNDASSEKWTQKRENCKQSMHRTNQVRERFRSFQERRPRDESPVSVVFGVDRGQVLV